MGNDGGSIPGRQDLVKEMARAKREETEELVKLSKSQFCSMTKEPFNPPLVGDRLGQIYNKKAVISSLLQKTMPKDFNHIKSLRDIRELNTKLSKTDALICPITLIEFTGINKFYFIWNCGCVMSSKAIKELNMVSTCIVCEKAFDPKSDLISLNYTNKEKEAIKSDLINKTKKDKELIVQDNGHSHYNKKKGENEMVEIKLLNRKRKKKMTNEENKNKNNDIDFDKVICKRRKII